ncbi:IucA/IucC family C-terminal-domain containing protein [Paenibacillus apis]|uniref:Aerobactin siderophore biosynthesis IucA/IucC-like C-terminal domain-containing protein n=1 Tax=Paenibacillus apis TaxID=1792174 RepID=A0A920CL53_9BACL|nr:IucA/IucC family C-terminal-domain containing protein [Paenibacillus apis]GIO41308.1 hypothetical protein J41TS4_10660 [Paenibacillus apis]
MENHVIVNSLQPEQYQVLADSYRLTQDVTEDRTYCLPFTDLLDPDKSQAYLQKVGQIYETDSSVAPVSMFAKRYAYLVIAANLYALSYFNKGYNLELENGEIESVYLGGAWLPKARLMDWTMTEPAAGRRAEWRDEVLERMFAGNLSRVWSALAKLVKVPKSILWENTAIYVYWLYEKNFGKDATLEQKQRLEEDYHYLLHDAPAHLFGEKRNPLMQFNGPKVVRSGYKKPIRVRKTCCFYYVTSDKQEDYCSSCPKRTS